MFVQAALLKVLLDPPFLYLCFFYISSVSINKSSRFSLFLCSLYIVSDSVSCIRLHQGPSEWLQRQRHHHPDLWGFCFSVAVDPRVSSPLGLSSARDEKKKKRKRKNRMLVTVECGTTDVLLGADKNFNGFWVLWQVSPLECNITCLDRLIFLYQCLKFLSPLVPFSGLVIAMVVSLLFLLLLRFIAPVMVWVLIIGVLGAGAYGKLSSGTLLVHKLHF